MLLFVAGLDMLSCIVVAEESFCSASVVGPDPLKKFFSSIEGFEVVIVLETGGRNAKAPRQR